MESVLPSPGVQELQVTAQRQEGVEQVFFRATCHQTAAELAQDGGIKAGVG